MSSLDLSLLIIYSLCLIARMWSLRAAWLSPLFYGERYFLDVPVAAGFYQDHGRTLLRRYRMLLAAPYAVELCCFVFLLAAVKLNHLILLMLAAGTVVTVNTLALGRTFRRSARRYAVKGEETAPGFALPLEPRRLVNYTNPAVEAGLAFGNAASLLLLVLWHRESGVDFWRTFRLPLLLVYAQVGFLLIKHALVKWRTAMPLEQAENYLDYREHTRRWFIEICDWLRAHSVAFLASYAAIILVGQAQNDIRVRWAILLPWTALAIVMVVRLIHISNGLRASGSRLKPLCPPRTISRATRPFYYNPEDPALFVRGPRWFTMNFADRRAYLYTSYVVGLLAIVAAGALLTK